MSHKELLNKVIEQTKRSTYIRTGVDQPWLRINSVDDIDPNSGIVHVFDENSLHNTETTIDLTTTKDILLRRELRGIWVTLQTPCARTTDTST